MLDMLEWATDNADSAKTNLTVHEGTIRTTNTAKTNERCLLNWCWI